MIIEVPFSSQDELLIKEGDLINLDTPLIKKARSKKVIINIAEQLNVNFLKIFNFLKKFVGETVSIGDILAEKKGLFKNKKVISPVNGVITQIDHNTGEMIIETQAENNQLLKAFFTGKIYQIKNNWLHVKVKKGISFNIKNASGNFGGKCFYLESLNFFSLVAEEVAKRIIIAEKIESVLQVKLEALGASGLITLYKLPTQSFTTNYCQLSNITDFNQIINFKYPYCLVISQTGKIYFYE